MGDTSPARGKEASNTVSGVTSSPATGGASNPANSGGSNPGMAMAAGTGERSFLSYLS